jgi:hypothetical protein
MFNYNGLGENPPLLSVMRQGWHVYFVQRNPLYEGVLLKQMLTRKMVATVSAFLTVGSSYRTKPPFFITVRAICSADLLFKVRGF